MHSFTIIAALSALYSTVMAVPMKRDLIVNTVTEYDVVTEYATETVWVDATTTWTATVYQEQYTQPATTAATTTTANVAPAAVPTTTTTPVAATSTPSTTSPTTVASSTTSVYVAPPAPTTSVYVAPEPTTTSVYVAPAPTTFSTYVAPSPTTTDTPPVTTAAATTTAAPAATTTAASSGGSQTYTGDITYYAVGLGSCGVTNTDSDFIVAMAADMMDKATMCGKTITISYGGSTHQATIEDTCPGCSGASLDLSPALFQAVAPNGDGRVHDVSWWMN